MTNPVDCPVCDTRINATEAALIGCCPECDTPFKELLKEPENDPKDAGPYYEYE